MAETTKDKAEDKGITKKIVLSEELEEIKEYAYSDIPLERVVIPKSVKAIGKRAFNARCIELYDKEQSLVSECEPFSCEDHLLVVRSAETDEIKFAVPVYFGELITGFTDRSDKLIMMLFGGSTETFDFTLYDLLFKKVYDGGYGNVRGKFMAAHYRLKYPNGLCGEAEKMYRSFIDENAWHILKLLIKENDADVGKIKDFPYMDRVKTDKLDEFIDLYWIMGQTELAEWLISYKKSRGEFSVKSFDKQKSIEQKKEESELETEENEKRLYNKLRYGEFRKFQKLAEEGDSYGQYMLALMYTNGVGTEADERLGAEWMIKSAKQGFCQARNALALYYKTGKGVEKDLQKAFDMLTEASEQGHAFSCNELGKFYEEGLVVAVDLKKAAELYEKAAEHYTGGMINLARCYEEGLGVEKDLQKAKELKEKAGAS